MPDHIHGLITPTTNLEKAVQSIKGGFSHRAKRELGSSMEVWQKGFLAPFESKADQNNPDQDKPGKIAS
jgi:REP element-mobilizing transposase RayT